MKDQKAKNKDTVGWKVIDNTVINHPLVQGPNNDHYLKRDADNKASSEGAIALDASLDASFTNGNNIIYGHNLSSNGKGFSELTKFKNKSFFDANKTGTVYTTDGKIYKMEIFAVQVTSSTISNYTFYYKSAMAFGYFLEEIQDNAMFYRNVDLQYGDQILTMVTCSYEFTNARMMVHAKLTPMN